MATMYRIIGGDQKEYGSVSAEDMRKWITEGRLSAQTLAKAEGDLEFRPLGAFPEFADALAGIGEAAAPAPLQTATDGEREAALRRVKVPAIALMITASLSILLAVTGLVRMLIFPSPNMEQFNSELQQLNNPQLQEFMQKLVHLNYGPFGIASGLFQMVLSALVLTGAIKMHSLRSYEFALTAAIVSLIPCLTPCCCYPLGLIFGIWALAILTRPEVKSQFH